MSVTVLVPPALDPVSLAEAKAFLQLDSAFEDALVGDLVKTAAETVEHETGTALIARTVQQSFAAWPQGGVFTLQARPLMQLIQVQRRDAAGVLSLVDPSEYYIDQGNARMIALSSFIPPPFTHPSEAILVDCIAGFGAAPGDVPAALRTAVLLIVRSLYDNRGQAEAGLPLRARALMAPFARVRL